MVHEIGQAAQTGNEDRTALRRKIAGLEAELAARTAERDAVLAQQTATTAEVLQVINSSPGDLAPVFDAMVERAVRLREADEAVVRTFDGKLLHLVAAHGEPGIFAKLNALGPSDSSRPGGMYDFLARGESVSYVADVRETATYRERPVGRARLDARNVRSWLAVALRKGDALLGIIRSRCTAHHKPLQISLGPIGQRVLREPAAEPVLAR